MNVKIWLNEDYSLEVNEEPYDDDVIVDMTTEDLDRYRKMKKEYSEVQKMLSEYRKIQNKGSTIAKFALSSVTAPTRPLRTLVETKIIGIHHTENFRDATEKE